MTEPRKHTYRVTGMTCATCSRMAQRALARVPGVQYASVNLATETAFVLTDPSVGEETLREAVMGAGYDLLSQVPEDLEARRYAQAVRNLVFVLALTIPLSLAMLAHMGGRHVPFYPFLELVLGGLVVFWGGRATLRGAWIALTHRHANMDTLVTLGALSSWSTALLRLAGVAIPSFGAIGAMILALHVLGRFIESHLRDRATREVKALMRLQAAEARVIRQEEVFLIPLEAVLGGDRVQVLPGERIPVDGRVVEGLSSVDESLVTGESVPVLRREGDEVTGGSLNLSGVLLLETVRVGEDAFLAQMLRMVREAQGSKVPLQALADRTTLVFVPLVAFLAAAAALGWLLAPDAMEVLRRLVPLAGRTDGDAGVTALYAAIATLVIACPCALGLATPMALAVGAGEASRRGMLLRNAEAFQTLRAVRVALLDKTGTLTQGEPRVAVSRLEPEASAAALALEERSNHPLARAVTEFLRNAGGASPVVGLEEVEETPGEGIGGVLKGRSWFVGRPLDSGKYRDLLDQGCTLVEVRRDGEVQGVLGVTDPLRTGSVEAVRRLEELGIRVVMATGDHPAVAERVARETGIREVHAGVHPGDKLDLVRRFQAGGERVLMVGDGLNDAGALKGADVGVAMGSGLDLALDSADLILVRGELAGLADAVLLSRKLVRVVAQNLVGAFFYNLVALPLAMLGLLHPALAEVAMGASSITVILNSLRIRGREKGEMES